MTATTVSIINLKGGVGKSTLTMILGEFLAFQHAKNVLLIDMDSQANLSYCMIPAEQITMQENQNRTTYHLLKAGFTDEPLDIGDYITSPPLVVSNIARGGMLTYETDIHMVTSTPTVAELDEDLMQLWADEKPMPQQIRQTLQRAIEPALNRYDYILIDCPPGLSLFSSAALMASDYYIAPVIPEPLSLQGVGLVRRRQQGLMAMYNAKAEFAGVILNVVMHFRNTHRKVSETIYANNSEYNPFHYWLPNSERLRRIGEYNPDMEGQWATGVDHKFPHIGNKYGLSYKLTNPPVGSLSRLSSEGAEYRLEERCSRLVTEFMERCPQKN